MDIVAIPKIEGDVINTIKTMHREHFNDKFLNSIGRIMFDIDLKDTIQSNMEILIQQLVDANHGNKKICLSYSMGQDCLVVWNWLKKQGMDVYPLYFEPIHMEFTDQYIKCHEKFFGTKIKRIPNYSSIADFHDFWGDDSFREKYKIPKDFRKIMVKEFVHNNNCIANADGLKASDSIRRRINFANNGPYSVNHKKLSPIWNLNSKGVMDYLRKYQIPIPDSYLWHKRSIELNNPNEFFQIKRRYPEDYERILKQWPKVEIFLKEDPKKPNTKNLDGCMMTSGYIFKYDDGKIKEIKKLSKSKLLTKSNENG
jgi:phosphoadenosine phosphosulfate reductase